MSQLRRRTPHTFRRVAALACLLASAAVPMQKTHAQSISAGANSTSLRATRTELATELASVQSTISSGSLKGDKRDAAMAKAKDIEARLTNGDFRVGDRFIYTLTMDSVRSDTTSVRDGLTVSILALPDLSVKGVLRSELDDVLNAHISKYFRNARIRTVTLIQVSILGAVSRPGYYWSSPDRPISELIMMAGGPVTDANLRELEVKRSNKVVLKSKDSRKAMEESRTLEQVDIRSGDEVRIPMKRKINWGQVIQLAFVLSSLFFAAIQFIQWYYNRKE